MKKFIPPILICLMLVSCHTKNTGLVADMKESATILAENDSNNSVTSIREPFCTYDKVSDTYIYSLSFDKDGNNVITRVYLTIADKVNKKIIQEIEWEPVSSMDFYNCESRSYINGYNKDAEVLDGMYGDIIINDFNFDNKEDLAVAVDFGYTEFYNFYFQKNGKFVSNNFLNSYMRGLPKTDLKNKTLTTKVIVGVWGIETQVFQFDNKEDTFKLIVNEVRDINTGEITTGPYSHDDSSDSE